MATRLELIQQYKAQWLGVLEAARKGNADFAAQSVPWVSTNKLVTDAIGDFGSLANSLWNDIDAVESGNPDAPISSIAAWDTWATTVATLADKVSPTAQKMGSTATRTALTTKPASTTIGKQGNSSTVGGSTNWDAAGSANTVIAWQTNKVIENAGATQTANNLIDEQQKKDELLSIEAQAASTDIELKRKKAADEDLAKEEDRIQQKRAADEKANLEAMQQKEREKAEAAVAQADATARQSERDLEIANDVALQKSNVQFQKLGLTLSTAATTQAQQIYTTWVYNLSKLKSDNAYKKAWLEVDVARMEFDHTAVVNKIINDSAEKSYTIKKALNESTHQIQMSIIDNRFERQKKIDAAVDAYQNALKENELEMLSKMGKANEVLSKSVENYYSTLKVKEEYGQTKINSLVSSGKWWQMGYTDRTNMEKAAWMQPWTISAQIDATIGSSIYKKAQEISWLKGITFTSAQYNVMVEEAKQLVRNGISPDEAMTQVITQFLQSSPEYQAQLAKEKKAWMVKTWGSGWTSDSTKWIYVVQELIDWKPKNVEYRKWDTSYRRELWVASSKTNPNIDPDEEI